MFGDTYSREELLCSFVWHLEAMATYFPQRLTLLAPSSLIKLSKLSENLWRVGPLFVRSLAFEAMLSSYHHLFGWREKHWDIFRTKARSWPRRPRPKVVSFIKLSTRHKTVCVSNHSELLTLWERKKVLRILDLWWSHQLSHAFQCSSDLSPASAHIIW